MSGDRPALFDLSDRCKLRLTGSDRVRFLNGQVTNDVRKAASVEAIQACVLNAKGKINAHLYVSAADDFFLIDSDAELQTALPARLHRYIIADDVQVEDITSEFALFHVTTDDVSSLPNECRIVRANRFGVTGLDLLIGRAEADRLRRELSATYSTCDVNRAEMLRIENGIPRWGRELTEEIIPNEAGLEEDAIDYQKGCYIGQEVISRIKTSGQTNKTMCGLVSTSGAKLTPGLRLHPAPDRSKDAGWITSATYSERVGKEIALGYVKRPFNVVGSELEAEGLEGASIPLRIVPLPFA